MTHARDLLRSFSPPKQAVGKSPVFWMKAEELPYETNSKSSIGSVGST